MFTEREWLWHCGTKFYYHVYPLLIFVNDEDDQWRTTQLTLTLPFLFVLSVGQTRPRPRPQLAVPVGLSHLLCSLLSALCSLSLHIFYFMLIYSTTGTPGPVQANFQTFNCSWCVMWLDTRRAYQYLYQCDIDVSVESLCSTWLTAKWR